MGAKSEECGDYFPDVLDLLETNQFIKVTDVICIQFDDMVRVV